MTHDIVDLPLRKSGLKKDVWVLLVIGTATDSVGQFAIWSLLHYRSAQIRKAVECLRGIRLAGSVIAVTTRTARSIDFAASLADRDALSRQTKSDHKWNDDSTTHISP
jgi:hypothetical protein